MMQSKQNIKTTQNWINLQRNWSLCAHTAIFDGLRNCNRPVTRFVNERTLTYSFSSRQESVWVNGSENEMHTDVKIRAHSFARSQARARSRTYKLAQAAAASQKQTASTSKLQFGFVKAYVSISINM